MINGAGNCAKRSQVMSHGCLGGGGTLLGGRGVGGGTREPSLGKGKMAGKGQSRTEREDCACVQLFKGSQ